jgi:hypothetical protein
MKNLILTVTAVLFLSGCLYKPVLIKQLEPVNEAFKSVDDFNCGCIRDVEMYSRCELMKMRARNGQWTMNDLGLNPVPKIPKEPKK